ncbi:AMP-binding protein [Kitasatospora sp. NBC_01266]|uniref:AMP-binding protein n=1 Tax=Kitasatospora sp. NBC_01266 TaxID=2903572 RepID=UPI002E3559C1|nr:AMP-binding protein [Kitasatospora sp. NBC_01266]
MAARSGKEFLAGQVANRPDREQPVQPFEDPGPLFPDAFSAQVARTPDQVALVHGSRTVSYADLEDYSNRLARLLISRGAGPGELVALALPRSADQLIAILAVLKSGAGYLSPGLGPSLGLSPAAGLDQAEERRQSGQLPGIARPVLLVTRSTVPGLPSVPPAVALDDPLTVAELFGLDADPVTDAERIRPLTARDTAFVIRTPGPSGTPEPMVVPHQGLPALAAAHIERLGLTERSRVLQHASTGFDAAVREFTMTLLSGAALVLTPDVPAARRESIPGTGTAGDAPAPTHVILSSAALATLPEGGPAPGTVLVTVGGPCAAELVERYAGRYTVVDGYGPTGTTDAATEGEALVPGEVPGTRRPLPAARVARAAHPLDTPVLLRAGDPGRPALFCLPPISGIAWPYRALAAQLEPAQPLIGLQARGLIPGHHPLTDPEELVADLVAQIRAARPTGPYHLLGAAFGGVLAHQVAVRLQQAGCQVGLLVSLDGYPRPAAPEGTPESTPEGAFEFSRRDLLDELGRLTTGADGASALVDEATIDALVAVGANHRRLGALLRPGVFRGDLLLFVAARPSGARVVEDPAGSWRPYLDGTVCAHRVDQPQLRMLGAAGMAQLGPVLAGALQEQRAPASSQRPD